MKEQITKIKQESKQLQSEVRQRTLTYIVGAMGLVAGLAWNDAIKSVIEHFFPLDGGSIWAKITYAVLVTFAVVVLSSYLIKLLGEEGKKKR